MIIGLPVLIVLRRGFDPHLNILFQPWVILALELLGLCHIYDAQFRN